MNGYAEGDAERGVRFIGAGAAVNPHYGLVHQPDVRLDVAAALAQARALLGEEAFARAWSAGRAMPIEQAISEALGRGGETALACKPGEGTGGRRDAGTDDRFDALRGEAEL